jgi:long-chain acyl-CoA synthetase
MPPGVASSAQPSRDEPRTLYDQFRQVITEHPEKVAFRLRRDGRWVDLSWTDHAARVKQLSASLLALGIGKGDRVAILSSTRLEWVQCDTAIVNIGAVTVGIYPSSLAADCAFILHHSGAKVAFVENADQLGKLLDMRADLPELRQIVVFDGPGDPQAGWLGWAELLERGAGIADEALEGIGRSLTADDLASLVYTSGTTGTPKGAMISHGNLVFVSRAAAHVLHIPPHFSTLLFLPLAHVFARLMVYLCQRAALTVAFAEELGKVAANLQEVRPHFIAAVPRIYEKIHEKILASVEEAGGLKRWLFDRALAVGTRVAEKRRLDQPVPPGLALRHALAEHLVLRKVRAVFGGRLVWAVSGSAPLSPEINQFFHACGVVVIEGLGMTENTSLSNVNRLERNKLGTVGPVVPGVEMRRAEDGEILFRGPNVMRGYFNDAAATAEAIDADGWLRSGDIGQIDADGYLTITDRKKDLIITAGGKNVAPQRVENALRASRFISQVVVCGDRRKFISALVALDTTNVRQWAREQGLGDLGDEELVRHTRVRELIETAIAEGNARLATFESVKKFRILPNDLSIAGGELTPTLKVKRKAVYAKHRDLIDEMYGE